jgi:hypothetical protein
MPYLKTLIYLLCAVFSVFAKKLKNLKNPALFLNHFAGMVQTVKNIILR